MVQLALIVATSRSLATNTLGTVHVMAISVQEMELLDEALGPQNVPERSTAIPFRISRILAKSADGRIHD